MNHTRPHDFLYVVAPYEADSQLAWLARNGLIDHVLTLDSDLVVLQCPSVFVKMWYDSGASIQYVYSDLVSPATRGPRSILQADMAGLG